MKYKTNTMTSTALEGAYSKEIFSLEVTKKKSDKK